MEQRASAKSKKEQHEQKSRSKETSSNRVSVLGLFRWPQLVVRQTRIKRKKNQKEIEKWENEGGTRKNNKGRREGGAWWSD
jgi:hypothetical protein